MRILALLKPAPGKSPADFAPYIVPEEIALWSMYQGEAVRDMHFDPATLTISLAFEAADKGAVETALQTLPMVAAGLFVVETIYQGPWRPIEALFRPGVLTGSSAVDVVKGIYDAVSRADWDGVLARLDADVVFEQSSALPFAGVWRGHDGFQKMGQAIFAAWPDFKVEPVSFAEAGDVVLVVTRLTGSNPRGDRPLDQTMVEYWRVADGKAVECRPFYFDPLAAARSVSAG